MNLYAIVLGIIVITLLVVSLARVSKVKTKADYLVAGRSLLYPANDDVAGAVDTAVSLL